MMLRSLNAFFSSAEVKLVYTGPYLVSVMIAAPGEHAKDEIVLAVLVGLSVVDDAEMAEVLEKLNQ